MEDKRDAPLDGTASIESTNKRRTRTIRDWEKLKQEYIRSDCDTIHKFFADKDISHGTYSRHTTGWKQLQRAHRSRLDAKLLDTDLEARALTIKQLQKAQGEVTKGNYALFTAIYPKIQREVEIRLDAVEIAHACNERASSTDMKWLVDIFTLCKRAIGPDIKTEQLVNERPSEHVVIDDKANIRDPELDRILEDFKSIGGRFSAIRKREEKN